mmetsp:Transcript_3818/g.15420  ORF Transcript_3818/g.15420 Transcript_3818/m.15420 type:complete len:212 (-) Transcript_3818:1186-1821(-)
MTDFITYSLCSDSAMPSAPKRRSSSAAASGATSPGCSFGPPPCSRGMRRVRMRSMASAAYVCTTFADEPSRLPSTGSMLSSNSRGRSERKVVRNLMESAFSTGTASMSAFVSSGCTCWVKKSPMFTSALVDVAPSLAVLPRTVSATTRNMAQSLAFQLAVGLVAYWPSMAVTYSLKSEVTCASKCTLSPFTSSHAMRRRVSLSLPSLSRRT